MARRIESLELAGDAGRLEALAAIPVPARPGAALLCHPHPQHGGTMHTKALHATARALSDIGLPVLRFNFRGVGKSAGRFTGGPGERRDAEVALAWLRARFPEQPLLLGGFSFGAWIALAVSPGAPGIAGLLALAPPLAVYDFGRLAPQGPPLLCVAGTRDPFCPPEALAGFALQAPERVTAVTFADAEHLLVTHLQELRAAVARFASACLPGGPEA